MLAKFFLSYELPSTPSMTCTQAPMRRFTQVFYWRFVVHLRIVCDQRSLARSIKMKRGNRTPEADENSRTTVGVDILPHTMTDGTECKIYDVAGQVFFFCVGTNSSHFERRGYPCLPWFVPLVSTMYRAGCPAFVEPLKMSAESAISSCA